MRTTSRTTELTIASRFCGPSGSGNGGYTAGSLARCAHDAADGPVEVTLRQPPPLDVAMQVQHVDDVALLVLGGSRIAEARPVDVDLEPVEAVSSGQAREAMTRFAGLTSHPFPACFSCGRDRAEGDGLRIFPGPIGGDRVAAVWTPHESVAESSDLRDEAPHVGPGVAWAALDCVSAWAGGVEERPMVLGRMTAQVDALPIVGEPHVVVGASRRVEGRKTFTASTIYDSDGRIVGRAQHIWIAIDPSAFS